jgi:hypothetical protein
MGSNEYGHSHDQSLKFKTANRMLVYLNSSQFYLLTIFTIILKDPTMADSDIFCFYCVNLDLQTWLFECKQSFFRVSLKDGICGNSVGFFAEDEPNSATEFRIKN